MFTLHSEDKIQAEKQLQTENKIPSPQNDQVTLSLVLFLLIGIGLIIAICFAFWGPKSQGHASFKEPVWQKAVHSMMGVTKNPNQNHSEDE